MTTYYPTEILDPEEDNGTMVNNKEALAELVVGHRIVSAEYGSVHSEELQKDENGHVWGGYVPSYAEELSGFLLTLDNGRRVIMQNTDDCCARTELESFMLNASKVDHIITGVGTTESYTRWHIYADMGDVLELRVNWTAGNPFYYGYGFDINVTELPPVPETPEDGTPPKGDPIIFTPRDR